MKALLWLLLAVLALFAAAPGLIYEAALGSIDGRPQAGAAPALNAEQRQWLRCELRADDRPGPPITNPWAYVSLLTSDDLFENSYGDQLAGIVARNYNATHLQQARALQRHLSGAALTIWVSRHWTQDQMEAQAHALLQHAARFHCPSAPAEWQP